MPTILFPNLSIFLIPKTLTKTQCVLRVPLNITKPQIRQYLKEVYGVETTKVNTAITRPRYGSTASGKCYKKIGMTKKAFVTFKAEGEDVVPITENNESLKTE